MAELRFSDVSEPRQTFIRECQRLGFGKICGLRVRDCEPAFVEQSERLYDLKRESDETLRPEQELQDFVLRSEIRRLFLMLDRFRNGTIEHVEIRAGIPRRMVFKATDSTNK